ncbi:hypothetical protein BDN67DRAFT_992818 [Paxillus ammoniavirescens]|nr:hypothetical protein BDN67DRAFT_992818 [Paxillus ammoniavirescens]
MTFWGSDSGARIIQKQETPFGEDDDAPLSLRRTRQSNQQLPLRFRDMLPEPPMPLPPPDQEFDHGSPQLPQSLELIPPSPELITPPLSIPRPCHGFKTQVNSFGLFHLYDEETVPSHDPQNCSRTKDPLLPTRFVFRANQNINHPFYPYPNETSLCLGDWYWNQGTQQSRCNFKKLLNIIASSEGDYSIDNFYHFSLMSIIHKKVLDPVHHQLFHYEHYELCWQPPHKAHDVRNRPENLTVTYHVTLLLMLWSDVTHLTSFSDAKLWPLYVYFRNESKNKRCQPSAHLCIHAAYFQGVRYLPDSFKDFALENTGSKLLGDPFFTHCCRELFHAQWQELLDDEFIYAYAHGIVLTCCDGVKHRLFPRIFTYLADYPKNEIDVLQQRILARRDTEERHEKVSAARKLIYEQQYVVDTPQVEALLKNESLVPTKNAFSDRLGHLGFDFYLMLVVDLLHKFELGIRKAIFIHLLRMLDSLKGDMLYELDRHYHQVPTFGRDTVCHFRRNVSEMKKMAARDFEDLLQCAIPVFAGLFPGPHHSQILKLMFLLGHWHGLAKLQMHTDETLNILESVMKNLGDELHKFVSETCPAFSAKELQHEAECHRGRQTQESSGAVAQAQGNDCCPKVLNLRTYKLHALGDYAAIGNQADLTTQIKQYGTTDSYSTQPGELEHHTSKSRFKRTSCNTYVPQLASIERRQARIQRILVCTQRNALTKYDPALNIPEQHYVIGKSQNFPEDLTRFVQSTLEDLAAKDFLGKLKTHLLPRIWEIHLGRDHANVSQSPTLLHNSGRDDLNQVLFKGNRIYWHHLCCINYTTYDLCRETKTINPKTEHRNIMLLARPDGPSTHPFCYAHILGVYHANVIYNGPDTRDYQSSRLEFLWVRWLELMGPPTGYEHCALDTARFVSMAKADACSFVDPADVLRCCHLIPAFADRRLHPDGIAMSLRAQDSDDWKHYYINQFIDQDMVMQYHWGLGIGHVYAYSNPTEDNQPDDCQTPNDPSDPSTPQLVCSHDEPQTNATVPPTTTNHSQTT